MILIRTLTESIIYTGKKDFYKEIAQSNKNSIIELPGKDCFKLMQPKTEKIVGEGWPVVCPYRGDNVPNVDEVVKIKISTIQHFGEC